MLYEHRLEQGNWSVTIGDKTVDLGAVARLTVRDLVVDPFTVGLLDGREAAVRARRQAGRAVHGDRRRL